VSRVPIRLRVTLAFTAAMVLVLIAIGLFLYFSLESHREETFDEALDSLATLLLFGGPAALLLAALVGYGVARATLRPVLDRLEVGLERERRFVDDASHELRTPLALHKAELELALRHGQSEEELRAAIASALEEVDHLIQLAEDLLVVARSEEGKLAVALEPIPVADLFATVNERFRARASEAGRPLVVDGRTALVAEGDRLRLEQALTNMVDNALRHGRGKVRIWASENGDWIGLHVGDQGAGFPPEFLAQAFERFSRADAARGRGGSGLGLAIVETIALAHGGRAGATNDPAGGADVWIEIPTA
jgi:two-component system, OmpR family, sensor kinase